VWARTWEISAGRATGHAACSAWERAPSAASCSLSRRLLDQAVWAGAGACSLETSAVTQSLHHCGVPRGVPSAGRGGLVSFCRQPAHRLRSGPLVRGPRGVAPRSVLLAAVSASDAAVEKPSTPAARRVAFARSATRSETFAPLEAACARASSPAPARRVAFAPFVVSSSLASAASSSSPPRKTLAPSAGHGW
jgi:hypothetical protein